MHHPEQCLHLLVIIVSMQFFKQDRETETFCVCLQLAVKGGGAVRLSLLSPVDAAQESLKTMRSSDEMASC